MEHTVVFVQIYSQVQTALHYSCTYDITLIIFKIKHKFYVASGSAPLSPLKDYGRAPHVDCSAFLSALLGHARHRNKFFYYKF